MGTPNLYKRVLLIAILFSTWLGFCQLSKTHYIPPLTESGTGSSAPQDHYIYISTPNNANVNFTIKPIGVSAAGYILGTVSKNTPFVYKIGDDRNSQLFVNANVSSAIFNNKGFIILAQDVVYVSVRINAGSQAGALVSKGVAALGTTFRVGSYTNENPQDNYLNFVSVMASEDNTRVTFSNLPTGLIIENYGGPIPVVTTLNKGETYVLATNSLKSIANRDGLIGCLVTSDKPIVVNCGSSNGSFHNGTARDYGIDQIVDASKVGTEYIFVRGGGNDGWENVLLVAHTDNTTIRINGGPVISTINAGKYYLIEGNQYTSAGNMYVQTSQPVFAYQGVGATNSEANQGMFFVPPLSCETRGNLDNIANITNIGNLVYTGGISIVTKATATITINNLPLSNFSTSGPNTVSGKPDYVTYKVLNLTGNVSVQSTDELYCAYFNFNGNATSGSFYSGFPTAPEINFNAQFTAKGNCIGNNLKLEAANAQNFDSFQWLFDDGSGYVDLMISADNISPTLPGKYKLIGVIACTGEKLESVEVPISICPDDIDNDGIIDNLDVDNDNDGILNCTESKGDVTIAMDNVASPQLVFQDASINTTIPSATFVQNNSSGNATNTFTGTSQGNFTSTVQPDASAESNYSLVFTQPVHVTFTEASGVTNSINADAYFIAKIAPANKNITLIDPDNRLLVDSNFDGVFETGITQISGSEIHFKLNPTPNGPRPFQFLANQVEGFSFIHRSSSITNSSTFTGNISLNCFNLDTDNDGIEDALDLDSDNDGIPDFVENQGKLVPLSGTDADLNGWDDIYNITVPRDSDNDGVYDFYDLDSDNDGIYDLEESGSGLPDTNFDGIIDNINTKIGTNGWDDNAETTPDSNVMGYTLNDLDTDTQFSYIDLDSDGDGCSDVVEAGFSDANADGLLGDNAVATNIAGKVTNALDGYSIPNANYLISAPISITNQPIDTETCELSTTTITLVSSSFDTVQWEVSTDGVNWNTILDNAIYSGSQTALLTITNTPLAYNTNKYRAFLNAMGNSCGRYTNAITLTVHALPSANVPGNYSQCDDASNDGQAFFNLELDSIKAEINPNYIVENLTFSYFLTQFDAENLGTPIPNPSNYQDGLGFVPETVWIRAENPYGCFRVVPLTLVVSPSSAALSTYNPTALHQCDDGANVRDGVSTFNLTNLKNYIETTIFSTFTVTASFYESALDAQLETNAIADIAHHQNTNSPHAQSVWVRVKSDLGNTCLGLQEFQNLLIVEALPIANPVPVQIACDNDSVINDGFYAFDTSAIETTILNGQSLANVNMLYTYLDTDGTTVINTTSLPNPLLTTNQIMTVRVTNNSTFDPDGACYDETMVTFKIDQQPIANPVMPQTVCDGDLGDVDDDGRFPFDTSAFKSTILSSQTGMAFYFNYIDEQGNSITNSTTLPNPLHTATQTIDATVVNPLNTTCTASTTINLTVNPLPNFTVASPQIVCTSDPTFNVELDPFEANASESFIYNWYFEGSPLPSHNKTLSVSSPGKYAVSLTKTDGTGCSRTREMDVKASEKATITQNDVTIVDLSENNSVTINTTNLGNGNYEFALREAGSAFINYQTEPLFTNVKPGFYTIYVQDAICGVATLDISVIGHTKFFTPNGDGYNDFWQIKGINASFQPNSTIYIFDRYGKLLKQLSVKSEGWDGTFNGAKMPTDDYWFKLFLEDGRQYSGHFTLKR